MYLSFNIPLSIYLSIYLSFNIPLSIFQHPAIYLSIYLSFNIPLSIFQHPAIYLSNLSRKCDGNVPECCKDSEGYSDRIPSQTLDSQTENWHYQGCYGGRSSRGIIFSSKILPSSFFKIIFWYILLWFFFTGGDEFFFYKSIKLVPLHYRNCYCYYKHCYCCYPCCYFCCYPSCYCCYPSCYCYYPSCYCYYYPSCYCYYCYNWGEGEQSTLYNDLLWSKRCWEIHKPG